MQSEQTILKRAEILNFFSALFCQPEENVTNNEELYETLVKLFEDVDNSCITDVLKMKEATAKYSMQELLIEYARLFIGPFETPVPLYSSMYFPEKTLMSNVTLWVMEFYKSAGLPFDNSIKDLPDHVAVETEFLYSLIHQAVEAKQKGDSELALKYAGLAEYFWDKHYSVWIPKLCDSINASSKNEFYRALANCLNNFTRNFSGQQIVVAFQS